MQKKSRTKAILIITAVVLIMFLPVSYALIKELVARRHDMKKAVKITQPVDSAKTKADTLAR